VSLFVVLLLWHFHSCGVWHIGYGVYVIGHLIGFTTGWQMQKERRRGNGEDRRGFRHFLGQRRYNCHHPHTVKSNKRDK